MTSAKPCPDIPPSFPILSGEVSKAPFIEFRTDKPETTDGQTRNNGRASWRQSQISSEIRPRIFGGQFSKRGSGNADILREHGFSVPGTAAAVIEMATLASPDSGPAIFSSEGAPRHLGAPKSSPKAPQLFASRPRDTFILVCLMICHGQSRPRRVVPTIPLCEDSTTVKRGWSGRN